MTLGVTFTFHIDNQGQGIQRKRDETFKLKEWASKCKSWETMLSLVHKKQMIVDNIEIFV